MSRFFVNWIKVKFSFSGFIWNFLWLGSFINQCAENNIETQSFNPFNQSVILLPIWNRHFKQDVDF